MNMYIFSSTVRHQQNSLVEKTPNQVNDYNDKENLPHDSENLKFIFFFLFLCSLSQGHETEELDYSALHFNKKNTKRMTKKRDQAAN
ncbi:MAG: hypothetical protein ACRCT3_20775, partial [Aeromonas hydrophila]